MIKRSKKSIPLILSATMLVSSMLPTGISFAASPDTVNVSIDTSAEKTPISPYIYGENFDDLSGAAVTARRQGGNRMTGYNWENNASNAGSDYLNNSDNYMVSSLPASQQSIPGIAVTNFVDSSISKGIPYSLVTLQMAGYVAKDMNGPVSAAETAPSARWAEVKPAKGSAFSSKPDLTDNYVYMDEYVNYLVSKYGKASTNSGIKGYSLDNEPALWPNTHSKIHPDKTTCEELVNKSTALSSAVKNVDPDAEIFGPALYGYAAYLTLQDAPDWSTYKNSYDNVFINYFLDQMKKKSETAGKRLLDVLDVHWYPEAQGGNIRICNENDGTNIDCNKARIQAPRTLWDKTYKENSWLSGSSYLPLLPKLNDSISKYYPGTKLAITEYYYGGSNHISGGIAEADVLGLYGKNNVYLATLWGSCSSTSYIDSGVNIYRNYDGKKSTYGDTSVKAVTSDNENSSVYSSYDSKDPSKLHIIMINKNYDNPVTVNFSIADSKKYTSGRAWAFDRSGSAITERAAVTGINNNTFSYTLPALSVYHIVLDSSGTATIVGDVNGDGKINSTDSSLIK
ncbi:MAG TPA: glycoside hydrolase family 44 protein, partial [Clostridia bacterium]